jgi:CheY-like chemotaxis protein
VRKDQFLATLAHELRNPLAPIRNASAVLQRMPGNPSVAKLATIVDRQVNHLTRLVDDLLDVARATSGKLELQLGSTKSCDVVTHALEIADAHVREKSHRLVIDQPAGDVFLRADHVRLVQSVANLLVNAAKFTPPGGDIGLAVRVIGSDIEFTVTDSGRGLAEQDLRRIFTIFEQARAPGEPSGGLGLGLHLVHAFAELHGGEVRAHSGGVGRGSRFSLRLPVVVQADGDAAAEAAAVVGFAFRRVLVVDDNVDAAMTLQDLLHLQGLEVQVVHDGAAAVEHAELRSPEVIVMDIGMPGMDGYEAARRIRAAGLAHRPLLIALTGWGQYVDKSRAMEAGFDFHFVKPLKVDQLFACLASGRPVLEAAPSGG